MYRKEYDKWLDNADMSESFRDSLVSMNEEEKRDAFGSSLRFGTAGLRGVMAPGTNRMNIYVVRKATQGLADHLNRIAKAPSAAISYDSRLNSRAFAEETASVLTANGIKTYIYPEMMPVPVLSYTVRKLGCTAGVMITASHNPKEYNGYKVYNSTGGQILDKEAADILECIEAVDIFDDVKSMTFEKALSEGCGYVDEKIYRSYIDTVDENSSLTDELDIDIVYTPLNGSGRRPVQEILEKNGFSFMTVPEQEEEDGNFPTCPYPNPEKAEVYETAMKYAEERRSDIIIATDPDCDRVGAMVRHKDSYHNLTGNDIGILLFDYICSSGRLPENGYLCTTIVTTPFADKIAEGYGVRVKRTHVGFKYIGQQIELDKDDYIFGFEESNGYLKGIHARDKDAVEGAKLLCQMAAYYKAKGMTLVDVLDQLYDRYGYVVNRNVTVSVDKKSDIRKIMETVRDSSVLESVFRDIEYSVDYLDEQAGTGLPPADVFELHFRDGARMIVRPSGTEPKVKLYLSACLKTREESTARTEKLEDDFNKMRRL